MVIRLVVNLRAVLILISLVLSVTVILYVLLKGKRNRLTYLFVLFQVIALTWSLLELFEVYTYDTKGKWFVTQLKFFPISIIGPIWLTFSLYYVEHRILKKIQFIYFLYIPPIIFYIFCVTNEYHYLYFDVFNYNVTGYGIVFWLHTVNSYICVLIGVILLIRPCAQNRKNIKQIFIAIATLIPMIFNALHVFKFIATPFDATPLIFPLSLTIFVIATFHMKFLNVMPFAFERIYERLEEGVIVIDNDNRIINYNSTFKEFFQNYFEFGINMNFEVFTKKLRSYASDNRASHDIIKSLEMPSEKFSTGELYIETPLKKVFQIKVRKIFDKGNELLGRCILFNDITEQKELLKEIEDKNCELTAYNEELAAVNEQLSEHLSTIEELTLYKERTRIAREVHDTLGHTLTLIIMLSRISKNCIEENKDEALEKLDDIIEIAQNGFNEIRYSIKGLTEESEDSKDLILAIQKLIQCSSSSNAKIKLTVMGEDHYQYVLKHTKTNKLVEVTAKVCKEAITNALRHGKAKEINIILKIFRDKIKLYIIDNGRGCPNIKKGFGLLGMIERVESISGKIAFGSSGEKGFNIHIELPIEEDSYDKCSSGG